jgi:hypothetical protein
MFNGVYIPFNSKLQVSRNLGLNKLHFEVLHHINKIRNRFGHRKGYMMEKSEIEALANKIDAITDPEKMLPCREFSAFLSGEDKNGNRKDMEYKYETSDSRMQFIILFVAYMLKLSWWLQSEFNNRNIRYTIIDGFPS